MRCYLCVCVYFSFMQCYYMVDLVLFLTSFTQHPSCSIVSSPLLIACQSVYVPTLYPCELPSNGHSFASNFSALKTNVMMNIFLCPLGISEECFSHALNTGVGVTWWQGMSVLDLTKYQVFLALQQLHRFTFPSEVLEVS